MARLALDIETISPDVPHDEHPDFQDSTQFEMLAVGLGIEHDDGEVDLEVLFREDDSKAAEIALLEETIDWLEANAPETVVTYNGDEFDLLHLVGRSKIQTSNQSDIVLRYSDWVRSIDHIDLKPPAWKAWGEYTSFENACANVGVDVPPTLVDEYDLGVDLQTRSPYCSSGPTFENGDVPILGEEYLVGQRENTDLNCDEAERLLREYTESDLWPLFKLADARPFA